MSQKRSPGEEGGFVMRRHERVVVMNPGPLERGRLAEDVSASARYAHVYWDDGTEGWPQARLLALEEDAAPPLPSPQPSR